MWGLTSLEFELVQTAAVVAVVGLFFEGLSRIVRTLARRGGARAPTIRAIRDTFRIIWLAISGFAAVYFTNLTSQLTVLTVSGIAGLIVSLALQTTLSNMVAGALLLKDRILRLGDTIEYSGVKGRIVRLGLRNTWIVTEKGDLAVIGNSSLHAGPLINYTATKRLGAEFQD